jgi:hypothetical protein
MKNFNDLDDIFSFTLVCWVGGGKERKKMIQE